MKEFKQESLQVIKGERAGEGRRRKGKNEGRGREKLVGEIENRENTPGVRRFLVVTK